MIRPNGPLICAADSEITLQTEDDELIIKDKEFALCRCGLSSNKPFCDGTHRSSQVEMSQAFKDKSEVSILGLAGSLTITVKKNAMYIINGPVTIFSRDGLSKTTRTKAALCRCGKSEKKPFCDVAHKKCGFIA